MAKDKGPRISANKLAEYMTADAIRRRQILKEQKAPKAFIAGRYSTIRDVIKKYIASGYNEDVILKEIKIIEKLTPKTPWEKDDFANSILALEAAMDSELPDLTEFKIKINDGVDHLEIGGVKVGVTPDILLNGKAGVGAMKIHIIKSYELEDESLKYLTALLKYNLLQQGVKEKNIIDDACIAFDVFAKKYTLGQKAYKRKMEQITASCEEIAARWDTL